MKTAIIFLIYRVLADCYIIELSDSLNVSNTSYTSCDFYCLRF